MQKIREDTEKIVKALGLEWEPIAVKFSDHADERGESRKIKVCEAMNAVRRENVILNFSKENCVCPGGGYYTGLKDLPIEAVAGVWTNTHKAYESIDVALASLRKQPRPAKRGDFLVLGPLSKVKTELDLVLFFANAEQADRVLGLVSFRGAEPFVYYPVSNTCSVITNSLAKGGPEIGFMAGHSRKAVGWAPSELIIALPFKQFETAVDNIPKSGFGTALMPPPP